MIEFFLGTFSFIFGFIMAYFIDRNVEVLISNDFWDMPARIKIGILALIIGILIICGSVIFMLITGPVQLLRA